MEKAKKDVGQKFRRIKHNLVNSSKKGEDDDLRDIHALENRISKMMQAVTGYRKNVASTIKTGHLKEDIEKRKRKLDESTLINELSSGADELRNANSTCLHKVMQKISYATNFITEERVKRDVMIEKRVIEDLTQYQEFEKVLAKSREKLNNALTDVDIAKRALEKSDGYSQTLQDEVDAKSQKLESQKDSTITDIYTIAAKEQEIAKVFTSLLEEQLEYHRVALRTIEMILPDIRQDIDNARPRPVFGIDLTEHLRHSQENIAVVLETCCEMLRGTRFTEKGLFRVSGNNTKIRRMKAAFDAGQIHNDQRAYHLDPHSVCSVLKSYLRELPDPLLTNRLYNDWVTAARLEGEDRLRAIEQCIAQLPLSHRANLTYLVRFLVEMLQYQDVTAMNAGNLAIVFGPNLLGGDIEGNNAVGTRIVETLLNNAARLFGVVVNGSGVLSLSTSTPSPDLNRSLSVDTRRMDSSSPGQWQSPRSRPKEKAPPPPMAKEAPLIDLNDEWSPNLSTEALRQQRMQEEQPRVEQLLAQYDYGNRTGSAASYDSSFDEEPEDYGEPMTRSLTERKPHRPPPPRGRIDENGLSRPISHSIALGGAPNSPPQPRARTTVTDRPMPERSPQPSNSDIPHTEYGSTRTPQPHQFSGNSFPRGSIKRPTILPDDANNVGVTDVSNRTVIAVEPPPARAKPPLPVKPKPDDKESSRL